MFVYVMEISGAGTPNPLAQVLALINRCIHNQVL